MAQIVAQWLRGSDLEMVLARDLSSMARWLGSISAHENRIKKYIPHVFFFFFIGQCQFSLLLFFFLNFRILKFEICFFFFFFLLVNIANKIKNKITSIFF
jgi:hypothetical protein